MQLASMKALMDEDLLVTMLTESFGDDSKSPYTFALSALLTEEDLACQRSRNICCRSVLPSMRRSPQAIRLRKARVWLFLRIIRKKWRRRTQMESFVGTLSRMVTTRVIFTNKSAKKPTKKVRADLTRGSWTCTRRNRQSDDCSSFREQNEAAQGNIRLTVHLLGPRCDSPFGNGRFRTGFEQKSEQWLIGNG